MLYYRMNAKRLELCPCPPLPACVEEYFKYPEFEKDGKYPIPETRTIQLQPLRSHGKSRDAQWFFSMAEDDEVPMDLDPACQNLYMRLFDCRKEVADSEQKYPKEITTNCALRTIALTRPKTVLECMKLRGTFPPLLKILSKVYVDIVLKFEKELLQLNLLMWTTKIRCQSPTRQRKRKQATKLKYHTSPHISPPAPPNARNEAKGSLPPTPTTTANPSTNPPQFQLPNPPPLTISTPTSATNGTTHNPTPPESSLPNTNPTPDTTLVFYMADTGLNEDEDEDEDEDIPEGTDKEIKAELAYPQEEDKKRKRDSDQGVQTGSEKEEVKNVG
ncbi:hypothetical protein HRS9139_03569 [Pyrenophora teres f. teres]|nr:hypothetical protein HRS9139_03569 [Pyrenophora teres f. teres]